jgi:hypothetical protein
MFEVGAVVGARCHQGDDGFLDTDGRHTAEIFQQDVGVLLNGGDAVGSEELREEPHHHFAVLQHVGDT